MTVSRTAKAMRKQVLADWGDDLTAVSLNYFADELPDAYHHDETGKSVADFPVLPKCETSARIRRASFAGVLDGAQDAIAAEIYFYDEAVLEGRDSEYEWGWAYQLPAAFRAGYDRDFHRHMLALAIDVWERMEAGTFIVPCCTAEELLLAIIFDDYAAWLRGLELKPGHADLDEQWTSDDDYLLLYNSEIAQRVDVLEGLESQLDTANLDFGAWFEPFYGSCPVPDPISELELRAFNG